jgi:hypothetical protein
MVSQESIVRLEFHYGKFFDVPSTLTSPRNLIGSFDFKVTDITNFDGVSLGMFFNPPLETLLLINTNQQSD